MNASAKEKTCIGIANEYRLAAKKEELRAAEAAYRSDRDALTDFNWKEVQWKKDFLGRLTQVCLLIPVVLLHSLLGVVVVVQQRIALSFKRRRIKQECAALQAEPSGYQISPVKTFERLWEDHGLTEGSFEYRDDEKTDCIRQWLDVLYGPGTSTGLLIRQRVEDEQRQQTETHAVARKDRDHICAIFVPPSEMVLRQLVSELPAYS